MRKWVCETCKKILVLENDTKPISCCYCGGANLTAMASKAHERTLRLIDDYISELDEITVRVNPKAEEIKRLRAEMQEDIKRYRAIVAYFSQAKHRGSISEEKFREICDKYVGINAGPKAGKQKKQPKASKQ